jgi:uncharacterized protein (TIGR02996 family)
MPGDPTSPPRPELLALLEAVKDDPDDDTPRLVLADWLEENGDRFDAERARFIRRQIAVARGQERPPASNQARRSEDELLRRRLEPFGDFKAGWTFVRGLPHITVPGTRMLQPDVPALLGSETFAFVQFVRLTEAGGPRMVAMAALPEFRHAPGLGVDPFNALGTHHAANFFGSPNLAGLRQIEFRSVDPGAAGMEALAKNPALARLRKLSLYHNKLVDKGIVALAAGQYLTDLTHLDLHDNNIGDKGAEALAASPHLSNLRELDLRDNPRLTDRGKKVLRDKFGDRVKLS